MNRLVIIGNGFDLAHGLPTSYGNFIDDFWKNFAKNLKTEEYKKLVNTHDAYDKYYSSYGIIESFTDFKKSIKEWIGEYPDAVFDEHSMKLYTSKFGDRKKIFEFKNEFFKSINMLNSENWVDIENEYYRQLKIIIKSNDIESVKNEKVEKLNKEFDEIKALLENYLIRGVEEDYVFSKESVNDFLEIFNLNEYVEGSSLDRFYMELPIKDENDFEKQFVKEKDREYLGNVPAHLITKKNVKLENYFLSFNYTSTAGEYIKQLDLDINNLIEIHGRLEDKRNPINFGFGDEMDKHYQEIEEINDNEYLRNIKSFQYLHTPNYKRLLDLIDSEKFQVYIMGHSCGLSDRTLLNTIFEHENCISIKIFYRKILNDEGNHIKDNYTEITQNISRHFNKKKLMREKIVNKTLCEALPQTKLPKKQNDPQ